MIADAPAKLNLFLRILARETSGFHQIESLFCTLDLCDEIEVDRSDAGVRIIVKSESNETQHIAHLLEKSPRDNIVHKAATAFFATSGIESGAHITLTKRIPSGAGLGGGSSDAAATLSALNELYAQPLDRPQMLAIAAQLGSDVPFFLCGSPLALAWGRGTRILPLQPLAKRIVVLVVIGESVSTADAYQEFAALNRPTIATPVVHDASALSDWSEVARLAANDFEDVIFARIPELSHIRDDLERHGARIARMTGSGSVIFGVFDDDAKAGTAADAVAYDFRNVRTILTHTAAHDVSLSAPPARLT